MTLVALLTILTLQSAGAGTHATSVAHEAALDDAKAVVLTFVRANEAADLEGTVNTFDDNATAFLPGLLLQRATGKAAIREAFRQIYAQRTGAISISLTDVSVQQFGDTAVVTAHLGAVSQLPVTQPTTFARRTFVLRHSGSRWSIVHLHASSVPLTPPR